MNQTPARLKSSSLRYQLPTGRSVARSEGKLTNQMGSTKRRGFEETDQRSEEVHVPQLGHPGLSKGEHGPDDLQCREEVGCSWGGSVAGLGSNAHNWGLVCSAIRGICPTTSGG